MRLLFLLIILSNLAMSKKTGLSSSSLQTFAGQELKVRDILGDGGSLLHFWAPWCHSCSGVLWDLDPIIRKNPHIKFLSINIGEDYEKGKAYMRKHKLYETYRDSFFNGPRESFLAHLGVDSVPTVIVLRPDGSVALSIKSHLNAESKYQILTKLQAMKPKETT